MKNILFYKIECLKEISILYNLNYELSEKILNFLKCYSKFNEEKKKFLDCLSTSLKNLLICIKI